MSCGGESALTSSATRSRPSQRADQLEAFAHGQAAPGGGDDAGRDRRVEDVHVPADVDRARRGRPRRSRARSRPPAAAGSRAPWLARAARDGRRARCRARRCGRSARRRSALAAWTNGLPLVKPRRRRRRPSASRSAGPRGRRACARRRGCPGSVTAPSPPSVIGKARDARPAPPRSARRWSRRRRGRSRRRRGRRSSAPRTG